MFMKKHVLVSLVLSIVSVSMAGRVPLGFKVLGDKIPDSAENIPIPEGFSEQLPETNTNAPAWTEDELKQGYVVFTKNYMDNVFPQTKPSRKEITSQLEIFSARGEYEPVTFSICALEPLEKVQVTVSDLKGGKGKIISKCNIDVRSVRCMPKRVWQNPPVPKYVLTPWLIEKRKHINIPKDTTQRFWLTVYVPVDVPAGKYEGRIKISGKGIKRRSIRLAVDVLSINLLNPPAKQGMYYWIWDLTKAGQVTYPMDYVYKEIMNMKEHGMNTMFLSVLPICDAYKEGDVIRFDLEPLRPVVEAYQEVGFTSVIYNVIINEMFLSNALGDFPTMVKAFVEEFKRRGWPEPVISLGDEADANNTLQAVMAKMKAARAVLPEVMMYETIVWPKNSEAFEPYADIRAFSSYNNETAIVPTKSACREYWQYSGSSEGCKTGRFYRGLWGGKLGLDGMLDWTYFHLNKRDALFDDLVSPSGGPNHRGYVLPSEKGPLPTPGWEGIREGVEDNKYIYTLKTLIEKARETNNKGAIEIADAAEEHIEKYFAQVDTKPAGDKFPHTVACGKLSLDFFDDFRYKTAQRIIKLEKKLNLSR